METFLLFDIFQIFLTHLLGQIEGKKGETVSKTWKPNIKYGSIGGFLPWRRGKHDFSTIFL